MVTQTQNDGGEKCKSTDSRHKVRLPWNLYCPSLLEFHALWEGEDYMVKLKDLNLCGSMRLYPPQRTGW